MTDFRQADLSGSTFADMGSVRRVVDGLTEESPAAGTEPVDVPGWPRPQSFPVRECLLTVLNEEWEHRLYAERDLAVLEKRGPGTLVRAAADEAST
ncbi:hypothetical protein AB0I28_38245 [Phytomonospora sp. NPDC050363]|uniref:hypothetical protein n=1 Tax=Phytomonospora sp. NPDC050363 TaxID=3155642 RepID=UPI00340FB3FC